MRWLRLLLLGLASVYPLYWTVQFLLFFVPESLLGFWLGQPVQMLSISYLQATAIAQPHAVFPAHWEALISAAFFSALIFGLHGDHFLTGAFAVVVFGQSALLPFFHLLSDRPFDPSSGGGVGIALGLMILGLSCILRRTGGLDFLDRLAVLTLLAVLPEAVLWLAFRMFYPFFDTRFLLILLVPMYLGAIIAALLPERLPSNRFSAAPWAEILASSALAGLLLLAIGLSGSYGDILNSKHRGPRVPSAAVAPESRQNGTSSLAASGSGMLT